MVFPSNNSKILKHIFISSNFSFQFGLKMGKYVLSEDFVQLFHTEFKRQSSEEHWICSRIDFATCVSPPWPRVLPTAPAGDSCFVKLVRDIFQSWIPSFAFNQIFRDKPAERSSKLGSTHLIIWKWIGSVSYNQSQTDNENISWYNPLSKINGQGRIFNSLYILKEIKHWIGINILLDNTRKEIQRIFRAHSSAVKNSNTRNLTYVHGTVFPKGCLISKINEDILPFPLSHVFILKCRKFQGSTTRWRWSAQADSVTLKCTLAT